MSDYFCQWCYDRGLRYPDDGKPWGHAIECPFRPASQTMNESQTPRCDAMMKYCFGDDREFIPIEKARELESQLTATRALIAELEGIAEALLDDRQGSGFYTKEIAALKAYKGKK